MPNDDDVRISRAFRDHRFVGGKYSTDSKGMFVERNIFDEICGLVWSIYVS